MGFRSICTEHYQVTFNQHQDNYITKHKDYLRFSVHTMKGYKWESIIIVPWWVLLLRLRTGVLPERHCGELAILLCADPTETAAESERSLPPISDVSETSTRSQFTGRKGFPYKKQSFVFSLISISIRIAKYNGNDL